MSWLKSMDQREEETNTDWLVHSDQWSLAREVFGEISTYAPDANSSGTQGKYFIFYCSLKKKSIFMHICIYVHLQINIKNI